MIDPILLKTLFTTALKAGIAATAATATIPAASAYSTRSCPLESFFSFRICWFSQFIIFAPFPHEAAETGAAKHFPTTPVPVHPVAPDASARNAPELMDIRLDDLTD